MKECIVHNENTFECLQGVMRASGFFHQKKQQKTAQAH